MAQRSAAEGATNEAHRGSTQDGIEESADGILERWFTPAYRSLSSADFAGYRAKLVRSPVVGYLGTCRSRDADLTESTRALKIPALCLVGDQDGSTPPDLVRSTADLITGADFRVIADAGHCPVSNNRTSLPTSSPTF